MPIPHFSNPGLSGLDELTSAEEAIVASIASLGSSGQLLAVDGAGTGVEWVTASGTGDMLVATYDSAGIGEQLVGLTATQTLTNKTLTQPTLVLKQGAAPAPTAEGDIQWDTDDNQIKVGDGASTKTFSDDSQLATAAQGALADSAQQPPTEGAFVDGDKTKLDGIEAGADVTDTANVTAAGALMDSEVTNLAQVKAFDSTDYATAAQGATADSALQPSDIASGTITPRADDINLSGGSDGDVLTVQADGSLSLETPPGGSGDAWSDPVDASIVPDTDSTYNLGSATYKFFSIYGANALFTNVYVDSGTGLLDFKNGTGESLARIDGSVSSPVNLVSLVASETGNAVEVEATGSDTNIDLNLVPKGTGIVKGELKRFMVQLLDSATAQTTGTSIQGDFRISNRAITVKAVGAYVDTAGTTGTCTVDINEAGTTILSTKITIDSTEKSSETAATAPVISDSAIAADAIITFDIDAIQTTPANGLKVWIDYVYA